MTFTCVTKDPTIVRDADGLSFVGDEGDPRREAVARIDAAAKAGKLPSEADLAMVQSLFVIDEAALSNIIFIIA
jgi:hypothetical protein